MATKSVGAGWQESRKTYSNKINLELSMSSNSIGTTLNIPKFSRVTEAGVRVKWCVNNKTGAPDLYLSIGSSDLGRLGSAQKDAVTHTKSGLQGYFNSEKSNVGYPTGDVVLTFKHVLMKTYYVDTFLITITYTLPVFVVSLSAGAGGTVSGAGTYDIGTNATIKATPNSGYKFVKWSDGNTNASRNVTVADGSQTAFSTSLSYSAVFEKEKVACTITYNGNGATGGSVSTQSGYVGEALTPLANDFEKKYQVTYEPNYVGAHSSYSISSATFQGWYTSASGGTKIGSSYTPSGNTTLYAHWSAMPAVTLPTPTRDGYTFLGWYTASENGTRVGDGGVNYTPNSNTTLYAHWFKTDIYIGNSILDVYIGASKWDVYQGVTKIYG